MENSDRLQVQECHDPVIDFRNVSFAYEKINVIDKFQFSILQRDFVGIIGPNGAGKSTLLKLMVGLLKPSEGEVRILGTPLSHFKDWEKIGYVPQRNAFNPLFPATVREVVLSGLYSRKKLFRFLSKKEKMRGEEALHALGIADLADRLIGKLSGGQQQRAFLARALINNPELLILDEPTVGIDASTQKSFFHLIRHMHQRHNITIVIVSHDMDMMYSYLGNQPAGRLGNIDFYVKHSHDLQDCRETDITHSLRDFHASEIDM